MTNATSSPRVSARRFVVAFLVSLFSMVAAAVVYVTVGQHLLLDWKTGTLAITLIAIGVITGLWLISKNEKHTGYGVLFGSLFGLILGVIAIVLIALLMIAVPAFGH